jgi:hypothetical protein
MLACAVSVCSVSARAEDPSVDDVRAAGDAFNDGRTAFKDEDFSTAAENFERADQLAPNPKVLLLAIQSRDRAGQLARAATLAALAQDLYPDDESFAESRNLISRALSELAKVKVTCSAPCSLMVDTRVVHGQPSLKRFLFLDPGSYKVRASFSDGNSDTQDFVAAAGESGKLDFSPSSNDTPAATPQSDDWGSSDSKPKEDADLPAPKATYDDLSKPAQPAEDRGTKPEGLSPTYFWVGAGLTGVLAGASIWSGVYTQSHPGQDVVRQNCAGLGTSCPEYQEGQSNQLRTNVLWGVTGGVGVLTILVGALWTDWGPPSVPGVAAVESPKAGHRTQTARLELEPVVSFGNGATLGARGRF